MENWKRDLQYAEKFGIQLRTQLRTWKEEPVYNLLHANDASVSYWSSSGNQLLAVPTVQEDSWYLSRSLAKHAHLIPVCSSFRLGAILSDDKQGGTAWYQLVAVLYPYFFSVVPITSKISVCIGPIQGSGYLDFFNCQLALYQVKIAKLWLQREPLTKLRHWHLRLENL